MVKGEAYVIKVIERGRIAQHPLHEQESIVGEITDHMNEFARRLKDLGVPVPAYHHIASRRLQEGFVVLEVATDEGERIEDVLRCCPWELKRAFLAQLSTAIVGVLNQGEPWDVGIDGNLRNFVVRGGMVRYIDFFPPRFRDRGIPLLSYPAPQDGPTQTYCLRRYYESGEVVRRLLFHLEQADAESAVNFLPILMEQTSSTVAERVKDALQSAAGRRFRTVIQNDRKRAMEIIEALGVVDFDELRDIALRIAPTDDDIRRLIHLDINLPLPEKDVQVRALKRRLFDLLEAA
jgi:hypothetical protein